VSGRARPDPVARFLGADRAGRGPFVLLGVGAESLTDARVIEAMNEQLARANAHPEADTPEADEVRLAIHAAAAQLLDPAVRRHLLERYRGAPTGGPPRRPVPTLGSEALAIEHDALLTLARYGGWNRESLRRLTLLAHARGIPNDRVRDVLVSLAHHRHAGGAHPVHRAAPAPGRVPLPPPPTPDEFMRQPRTMLVSDLVVFGAAAASVITLAAVMLVLFTGNNTPKKQATPASPSPVPSETAPAEKTETPATPAPEQTSTPSEPDGRLRSDPTSLVRDLRAAIDGLSIDPVESREAFARSIARFQGEWPQMPTDRLRAASVAVVEYVYRASGSLELLDAVVSLIASPAELLDGPAPLDADSIDRAAWSVGMLTRLTRERDLPAVVRGRAERTLSRALDGHLPGGQQTMEDGLVAALASMPARLLPGDGVDPGLVGAWERWIAAVDAACGSDAELRTAVLLRGLDTLVREAPEPSDDERVFEAIGLVVGALTWREGEASRAWVVRAFDARAVTNADLEAVTTALASRSSARGVDITMILRRRDNDRQRVSMRDRYARVWGIGDAPAQDRLARRWLDAADRAIAAPEPEGSGDALARTIELSRLSEAAALRWAGSFDAAEKVLDLADQPPTALSRLRGRSIDPDARLDWAVRYRGARQHIDQRLKLLSEVSGGGALGSMAAEVLAYDAVRGSPARVREAAYAAAVRHSSDPAMVNALLELLPRMPRTMGNARLVAEASLSPFRRPNASDWEYESRRALVSRLLELIASRGEFGAIDDQAHELAESYQRRAAPSHEDPGDPPDVPDAGGLARRWLRLAGSSMPSGGAVGRADEIQARLDARLSIANGPIQTFHARQLAACEFMAFVVSGEQPDLADEVRVVLDDLGARRRSAGHIFEQVEAAEAAMLRLWIIRYGEVSP